MAKAGEIKVPVRVWWVEGEAEIERLRDGLRRIIDEFRRHPGDHGGVGEAYYIARDVYSKYLRDSRPSGQPETWRPDAEPWEVLKRCSSCDEVKPRDAFADRKSAKDGKRGQCRDCRREVQRGWIERNAEKFKEDTKRWREANPEKVLGYKRAYRERNRSKVEEARRKYREENPEKRRAHTFIMNAVKRGTIERPDTCEACGQSKRFSDGRSAIDAHHFDYSKPGDVRWLCRDCHAAEHRKEDAYV